MVDFESLKLVPGSLAASAAALASHSVSSGSDATAELHTRPMTRVASIQV